MYKKSEWAFPVILASEGAIRRPIIEDNAGK